MSSIYRKGRDGYYYYQTYIYNPETGKKDKRIFHSLGTKNSENAKQKQIKLDAQYEKTAASKSKRLLLSAFYKKYKIPLIVVTTVITTIIIMKKYQKPVVPLKDELASVNVLNEIVDDTSIKQVENDALVAKLSKKVVKSVDLSKNIDEQYINEKPPIIENKPIEYQVIRIESGSGTFDQGKIYATAPKRSSSKQLLGICKELVIKNNEFSNFIICIYDDTRIGLEIAQGKEINYSNEQIKKSWLAMFSYNPVEGEYFDDNPGGYMGAF